MKYYVYVCSEGMGFVKACNKWFAKRKVIKSQGDCFSVYQLELGGDEDDNNYGFDKFGVTHPCIGI